MKSDDPSALLQPHAEEARRQSKVNYVIAFSTAGIRWTHGLDPAEMTRMYEHHDAVLHSVREGVLVISGEGRLLLANDEARRLLELPADAEQRQVADLGLEPGIAGLLASGRTAADEVLLARDRLLAVNVRPVDRHDGAAGSVATLRDTTDLRALTGRAELARERLQLLYDAGVRIGTTLDVVRTAEELAEVAVPRFADFVTVELLEAVPRGDQPNGTSTEMLRTVVHGIREDHPFVPVGELIQYVPTSPVAEGVAGGATPFSNRTWPLPTAGARNTRNARGDS